MQRLRYLLVVLSIAAPACFSAESYARKNFANEFHCNEALKVTDAWEHREDLSKVRVDGCGKTVVYLCDDGHQRCVRPDRIVRQRHARQFQCDLDGVSADLLRGNAWRATGCGSTATYVCDDRVNDLMCVMETSEGGSRRHRE